MKPLINIQIILSLTSTSQYKVLLKPKSSAHYRMSQPQQDPVKAKFLAACQTGDVEYVTVLLSRCVDVDSQDDGAHGWTGLHAAACKGHLPVLEVLMEAGAELNPRARLGLLTPLYLAVTHRHHQAALALISRGADVHLTTDRGESILQQAALKGLAQVVEELIRRKVYINERDNRGSTALGKEKFVRLFSLKVYFFCLVSNGKNVAC